MKEIVSIMLNTVGKRTKQQMSIRLNAGEDVKGFPGGKKGYDEKIRGKALRRPSRTWWRISWRRPSWKEG